MRSGASVTIRIVPRPAFEHPVQLGRAGVAQLRLFVWQGRSLDSQGSSKWVPAINPSSVSSAITPTIRSRSAGPAVTSEAMLVVVPCRRCRSTAALA